MSLNQPSENKEANQTPEAVRIEERGVSIGDVSGNVKVRIEPNRLLFAEDVKWTCPSLVDKRDLNVLFKSGILRETDKGIKSDGGSSFELGSDGYDGHVQIRKEDLNMALVDKRLTLDVDNNGDIYVSLP